MSTVLSDSAERPMLTLTQRPRTLTASRLKVSTTLDATELLAITAPEGKPCVSLRIRPSDRTVTAESAQTAIRKVGAG
jgi:hypothetical protein